MPSTIHSVPEEAASSRSTSSFTCCCRCGLGPRHQSVLGAVAPEPVCCLCAHVLGRRLARDRSAEVHAGASNFWKTQLLVWLRRAISAWRRQQFMSTANVLSRTAPVVIPARGRRRAALSLFSAANTCVPSASTSKEARDRNVLASRPRTAGQFTSRMSSEIT